MKRIKEFYCKYLHTCGGMCLLLSFVLNFVIESLARQSVTGGIMYLLSQPLIFLYNMLIIFTTLSIALIFRRRLFTYVMISILWLGLGITNGIILSTRMTPFTTKDLAVFEDGLSIVTNYLSTTQIVLAVVGVVILVLLVVLFFIFAPKKKDKMRYKKNIAIFLAIALGLFGATNLAIKTGLVDTFFGNLAYAYRDYGVPYCFINTWLNTGIGMPQGYSEEKVLSAFDKDELSEEGVSQIVSKDDGKDHPNVLILQLESFIDPTLVKTIKLSEDPIPTYRELSKKYSSGYLTVPSVGAGTANTEFEVLSGMSVKFFGPGEYPYKSILENQTCETLAYNLKSIGYSTHAIHNHRGAFYGRNKVFPNLGFDTFTSLEYMNYVVKTPKSWAKDAVLTQQIMDALKSTETEDFVFTVSVQGHGKYPTEQVIENPAIVVEEAATEEQKWEYEYYVNQLKEMDDFVKQLTDTLSRYDEPVVLVMYGDHLPALEMTEADMANGSIYQTRYVIWSNYKLAKKDRDLAAYEISAELMERLNINVGTMTKFHQNHEDDKNYLENLRLLEYDMLYGKQYIYGGKTPFNPVDTHMGVNPIRIEKVVKIGAKYYLKGENFTEFSKISLDGEILGTMYLGPTLLELSEKMNSEDVSRMKVSQVEKNKEILSTTE